MFLTYKYRIYPTKEQKETIEKNLFLCRQLYNTALEQRIFAYREHGVPITYNKQQNELSKPKKELPEYKSVHSQVLQDVLKRLDLAFQHFFRRVNNGEKAGFPRFQGKNRYDSFTYTQSGFALEGNKLKLSKVGSIRINLHRQLKGNVKTCTIIRKNGKYYVCFTSKVEKKVSLYWYMYRCRHGYSLPSNNLRRRIL